MIACVVYRTGEGDEGEDVSTVCGLSGGQPEDHQHVADPRDGHQPPPILLQLLLLLHGQNPPVCCMCRSVTIRSRLTPSTP